MFTDFFFFIFLLPLSIQCIHIVISYKQSNRLATKTIAFNFSNYNIASQPCFEFLLRPAKVNFLS